MLGCDHEESEASRFSRKKTLQTSRQADPAKLLARRPPQYGLHGMLPDQGSTATQQEALQTTRASDLADSLVGWISQQGLRAVL